MEEDSARKYLLKMLKGGNAHVEIDKALTGLPFKLVGAKPDNVPYTIWQLAEHLRISQWDIIEFSRNPKYESPQWPEGYWPESEAPTNQEIWKRTKDALIQDKQDMIDMLADQSNDLYEPFAHGNGQNLFREACLIIDHNAYHIGQIILIRKLLNAW
ncbi:MAG TPA: DinB family protein [Balneolales bacterium]|nr:DinB family protein [Balneolales bacterium]